MIRLILIVTLALISSARAGSDFINNEAWRDDFRRKAYNTAISYASVVAKSPAFDAETDEIPLTPREAVLSARGMLSKLVPNATDWKLTRAEIHVIEDPAVLKHPKRTAYFLVGFLPPDTEINAGAIDEARIIVTLTGQALRPTAEHYNAPNIIGAVLEKPPKQPTSTKP